MVEPPEMPIRSRGEMVRDTIEALRARAHLLQNWNRFYKWSILGGLTGTLGGLAAAAFVWLLESLDGVVGAFTSAAPLPGCSPWCPHSAGCWSACCEHGSPPKHSIVRELPTAR